jgi:hypothetical protein
MAQQRRRIAPVDFMAETMSTAASMTNKRQLSAVQRFRTPEVYRRKLLNIGL